jgi:hypothetical protein
MFKLGLLCLALVTCVVLFGSRAQALTLQFLHNDQLHYGSHLLAGRVLSLCPCTDQLAETQYVKGFYHARSPLQIALLTTQRPSDMRARLREAALLAKAVLRPLRGPG